MAFAFPAAAQLAASAAIDSNYVVRGVSFSDGEPTASLNVSYDHPSGFYAAITGMSTDPTRRVIVMHGAMESAGYARRLSDSASVDVGVSHADYNINTLLPYAVGYSEVYSGVTFGNVSAYVYYAPKYLGEGPRSLYFDLSASVRPAPKWRVSGHVGALSTLGKWGPDADVRQRYDFRVATTYELGATELKLAWTSSSHYYYEPPNYARSSDAVIVGVSHYF